MKRGRTISQLAKISLTAAAALLLLSQAVMADEILTEAPIVSGQIQSAGIFENSYYSYSGNDFDVEIGDKALDDEKIVKFEALPVKEDSVLSTITKLIGLNRPLGIQFNLINAYDSDLTTTVEIPQAGILDSISSIFNSPDKSNIEGQGVKVDNAIADLDIKYSPLNKGLKEEIIIPGDREVFDTYQYQITLDSGVKINTAAPDNIYKLGTGTIYFTDLAGNYFAHFLPLVAYDSLGAETTAIEIDYELVEDNTYILTVTIDRDWLFSTDRQYPVTIDPTIVHDTETEFDNATALNRIEVTSDPYVQITDLPVGADIHTAGLWHMEGSGATVTDSSANNNDGTATNTTSETGKHGNARGFAGNDDYISVSDDTSLKPAEITVEAWVNPDSFDDYDTIVMKTSSSSWNDGYGLAHYAGTNDINFFVNNYTSYKVSGTLEFNQWSHVVGTYDGSQIRLYINGKLIDSYNYSSAINHTTQPLYIGMGGGGAGSQYIWNGEIDEVAIYSKALTPAEILSHAQLKPYGTYTSEVLDLGTTQPTFSSFEWTEHGVRTGDGETDLTDNALVAHWKFNETSGTTVSDSSGNGHNGTATNMTTTGQDDSATSGWTANNRKWGAGALMLDGSNDYVNVPNHSDLQITNNLTVSAWIKTNGSTGNTQCIIRKNYNYWLGVINGSYTTIGANVYTTSWDGTSFTKPPSYFEDDWHHIAMTYDGSTLKLYLDGKLDNSKNISGTLNTTSQPLHIGSASWTTAEYYKGLIDSASIYNRVLSEEEILSNYQAGNVQLQTRTGTDSTPDDGSWEAWSPVGGSETQIDDYDDVYLYNTSETGLLNYWPMNETSGTNVDDVANNNDGTSANTDIVDAKYAKGLYFDSTSDQVTVTDTSQYDWSDEITISTWFKIDDKSVLRSLVSKVSSATTREFNFNLETDGRLRCWVSSDGSNASNFAYSLSNDYADNEWHYGACVYDGSNIRVYVDGLPGATASHTGNIYNSSSNLVVGNNANNTAAFWNGYLDEVKLYDASVSGTQIYEEYLAGIERFGISPCLIQDTDSNINIEGTNAQKILSGVHKNEANTFGVYHFNETGGSSDYIKDASGNGKHLTPTNTQVVDGFESRGRYFDGSGDQLVSASSADNYLGNTWVFQAWLKPESYNATYNTVYSFTPGNWLQIFLDGSGRVKIATDNNGEQTWTEDSIPLNQWSHLAVSNNSGTASVYIDGQLLSSKSLTHDSGTTSFRIGWDGISGREYTGIIDEVSIIKGDYLTAEEIYESYRAGRGHRIQSTLDSSVDLSANTLVPFYIASDQPGTHAEVTFGESPYANNMPDEDTVGLWHFDRAASGFDIIDSSSYSHDGTENLSSDKIYSAKIGQSRYFNGSNDWVNLDTHAGDMPSGSDNVTVSAWVRWNSVPTSNQVIASYGGNDSATGWILHYEATRKLEFNMRGNSVPVSSGITPIAGKWYHIVGTYDHSSAKIYIDGKIAAESNLSGNIVSASTLRFGNEYNRSYYFNGYIDEIRIDEVARSADEIRQAYEYEKRTHPVTIDFAATLDSGNLITGSGDTSFTIDATAKGFINKGSNLYVGDKIIVRENYDGTEYIAQGTVNSVNASTGAVTVASWDTGGTFPSGGYTANADVFKWQREYFDISDALDSHINAVDNITWRILDGDRGRTFWVDDLNMVSDYLTDPTGATIASTPNQYFQYRILETSTDNNFTSKVSSVTLDYSYPITITGGSTSQSYIYNGNKAAFNVQCNGVTIAQTGKTVYCEGSWNQSDWYTVGTASSPLSDATIQGDVNVTAWNGYPADGNVTLYVRATVDSTSTPSESFMVQKDTVNPTIDSITSVAGDSSSPYYDTTDDSSTIVLFNSTGASACKWDESDVTYTAMTNDCDSTGQCTLDLSGLGAKSVSIGCIDSAGNYTGTADNYDLSYTIGGVSMTGAQSDDIAINNYTKSAYNIQCNGVTAPTTNTIRCYASFDQSDWHEVDNTTAPISGVTLQGDMNVTGWTGYAPDGAKTIYTYVSDGSNDSEEFSFATHVDTVYPVINSITSVAGDTTPPYEDATNNASTFVAFDASADSDQCRFSTSDEDYDSMTNSCGVSGNSCNLNFTGVQAHTAYIRCIDTHGNKQQSSLQVDYEIISEAPVQTGWKYYRDINLSPATTVTNEQIKIELTPGNFDYANAQDDGGDLRFFDQFGETEFDYWIETWNASGTSEVWVEIPDIGTTNLLMQYSNDSATNGSDYDSTFTKDFSVNDGLIGLWHMDEKVWNSCSGGEDLCDSSGNDSHAIASNQAPYLSWREVDGGQWDSRSDMRFAEGGHIHNIFLDSNVRTTAYIPENDEFDLTQAITLEAWVNSDYRNAFFRPNNRIITKANNSCSGVYDMYTIRLDGSNRPGMFIGGVGSAIDDVALNFETWYHIVGTYDNATNEIKIYVNGNLKNTTIVTGDNPIPTNDMPLGLGMGYYNLSQGFDPCVDSWQGEMDDARIYNRAITAAEVLAHYERRNTPTGSQPVATVGGVRTDTIDEGGQEDWLDDNWSYRTELSIINEDNNNTLTDYQVQLNLDTKIYIDQSQMQSDGDDIRFADSDGTTLMPYYIISGINTNNTRVYVKIPSIPANNNKTIYMYYGNPSANAYEDFDNTFTKDYGLDSLLGQWNFDEGSNDTCAGGEDLCDSSGNDAHATFVNDATWQGSDGAQWDSRTDLNFSTGDHLYFDGTNDYASTGNATKLINYNNQLTLSAWVKPTSDAVTMPIISQSATACGYTNWYLALNSQKQVYFATAIVLSGTHTFTSEFTVDPNVWTHVAATFDGINAKLYKNGILMETFYDVHNRSENSSYHTFIGTKSDGCGTYFKGYLDELGVYSQALNDLEIMGVYERRKASKIEPQAGYYRPGYIEVGGEIQSENWEMESTIFITDPVTIAAGETLTIEPGTVIKFAPDAYIEADGATIIAEGTANNPIYFTSMDDDGIGLTVAGSDATPSAGDYNGIYVYGSGSSGSFKFCDFNYGGEELLLDGTTFKGMLNTKQVDITAYNNVFNNSANADIFVYDAGPDIQRNSLGDSPYGLYIDAGGNVVDATIEYNSFASTTLAGLYIDNLPDTDNDGGPGLVLRHNDFDNTNTGFYIDNPSGSAVRDSDAENTVDATMNAFENLAGYMCYYDVSGGNCKFDRTAGGEILFDTNSAIVTAPNGGESFFAGSNQNITWSFNNGSTDGDYLDIMLSTNSGAEFDQTVVAGLKCDGSGLGSGCTGTSGTYNWTVPSIGSTETRVKVSMKDSSGNTLVEDISDDNFSITVMQDTLSDYTPDADSTHTIQFVVRQNSGTFIDDSVKITFPDEFDLSLSAADVSASGGDVTWSSAEIIDTNSVTFPFTGTLDYNDSAITITIGNTTSAVNNPENEGSYRITLTIHEGQSGSGSAVERLSTNILITEGLAFTINVESALEFSIRDTGDTQDITTLDFGDISPNTIYDKSHILKITSNAFNGYTITAHEEHDLSSSSDYIPDIDGTNDIPVAWSSPPGSGTNGYYGYHTSDTSLGTGTTTRFAAANSWAALTSDPLEVAYSNTLVQDEITTMTYRVEINSNQTAGAYSHTVLYIATPKY